MKLYDELAEWWPLMSAPDDYAEEAAAYTKFLLDASDGTMQSVLELGSGGGNNASHMKRHFAMTLIEPSAGMLDVSRRLNPDCEHHLGDMRTFRVDRTFDGVFVHDAVAYMTTLDDLRKAFETAFVHLRTGGVALFCPDATKETFEESTDHGGHDGDDRAMRYLEWVWDPVKDDSTYRVEYVCTLREGDNVRVVHDSQVEGLFSQDEWLTTMRSVGFEPEMRTFAHSEVVRPLHVFVGRR